jgi:hypothetical protein
MNTQRFLEGNVTDLGAVIGCYFIISNVSERLCVFI